MAALRLLVVLSLGLLLGGGSADAQPREFRDCADCPEMVWVPAGSFELGVRGPEEEAREGVPAELRGRSTPSWRGQFPQRFALGRFAITRGEFAAFVHQSGHRVAESCYRWVNFGQRYEYQIQHGTSWRSPGFEQTDRHPVVCVGWDDAWAYVDWLSRRTGRRYRLPSEAEWEYAARSGTDTARFWGDGREAACRHANVADLSLAGALNLDRIPQYVFGCTDGFVYTSPVGAFSPNAFGLYDMLGNVWQWNQDCWNPALTGIPRDGAARNTGDCSQHVARGGSWLSYPRIVRAAVRYWVASELRYTFLGFRVARSQ